MFRSALAAALRHLYRGKLYAAIAVFGLAVGLCAALLAALYIRSQYSYDHFVAGYRDVYLATMSFTGPDQPSSYGKVTPVLLAALLKQRFPEIASVTRMNPHRVTLRYGEVELGSSIEDHGLVSSVDPNFFDTLPLPVLAGDPVAALSKPDQLVMTREIARKLFGDEPALGRTLEVVHDNALGSQVVTVTVGAVIDDIPDNRSQLESRVFVSGRSAWTQLAMSDRSAERGFYARFGMTPQVLTLVRLHPGALLQSVRDDLPEVVSQINSAATVQTGSKSDLDLVRIDRVQTSPHYNPGITGRIVMTTIMALVILVIAAANFVNLLTARSSARVLEVGVRKLAGARRATLALQFLGEAFVYVTVAVVAAVAMTELLLPHVNAFLVANAEFKYWKEPALLGWMLLGTIVFGLLAGFWPALVLSALRPLGAMHGARLARGSGGFLRQSLVSLQFALLTSLILAAGVMYLQRHFATEQALRFDTDQVLIVEASCSPGRMAELRKLAGVRDAACSYSGLLGGGEAMSEVTTRDGGKIRIKPVQIDDRMLGLYGIAPLAGRGLTASDFNAATRPPSKRFLINEAAMRALGFSSPAAALGPYQLASAELGAGRAHVFEEIIGVVPDFSMAPVNTRIGPTVFYADPVQFSTISVKLKGTDIPATLADINLVWKSTSGRMGEGPFGKLNYYFYDERVQRMYQSMLREARAFGIASLVAISLALLGLLGLAASAADRRTKEIGIRKALGATTGDVLRLLLWQFSKPVVWANLIAWPVAGWAMQRWLNGFAYHIDLPLWLFPATLLATMLVALATVSAHALRVARAKPVTALRYE
ncbi:MAG: FtsX-like permease family protein [Steroidobacteraceae bacterium]